MRGSGHAADAGDRSGAPLRAGGRHDGARTRRRSRTRWRIVEDCCQAHLATEDGFPSARIGIAGAFSFYPTKNLGALGDGGAVITNDAALATRMRRLRNGGQPDRYHHVEAGVNSRLDEMQAAILRARLPLLARWTGAAARAGRALSARSCRRAGHAPSASATPATCTICFPVRAPQRATRCRRTLRRAGIETLIHYPVPLPQQPAFAAFQPRSAPLPPPPPRELFSLPLYPRLADEDIDRVARARSAPFRKDTCTREST